MSARAIAGGCDGEACEAQPFLSAPLRAGRSTKLLVRRLQPGEIALIDHLDLDRVSAEELIDARAGAVINCRPCSSGSYPNLGPQLLLEARVPLVEVPGDGLFEHVGEGERIGLCLARGAAVRRGRAARLTVEVLRHGSVVERGRLLDLASVRAQTSARRAQLDEALDRFARNTLEHLRQERELLGGCIAMPRLRTDMRERCALVLARGAGHRRDLRALMPFISAQRPLLIAVDGAADALLQAGLAPEVIVGDMDSASEQALRCGAELVLHCYPDGRAPGGTRLRELGLSCQPLRAPGTSEDLALLLAAEQGARPIVSVGSPLALVELLDRNRMGISSTLLTRLRLGEILVDARGVGLVSEALPPPARRASAAR